MSGAENLSVKGIFFSYGKRNFLQNVSFSALSGELLAIAGPNGAGKSTLLKIASGYLKVSQGNVVVRGFDLRDIPASTRASLITYVGQEPDPSFDFTVEEEVLLGREFSSKKEGPKLGEVLKELELWDLRERPVTSLSSGEAQRVGLARALYQNPDVLLLDEPTAHMDMAHSLKVMDIVMGYCRAGKTAVCVFHDVNLALRYANRILFMREGAIAGVFGPEEVDGRVIAEVYGVNAAVQMVGSLRVIVPLSPLN